jgi:cyclic pyranopterin phosphate synthase
VPPPERLPERLVDPQRREISYLRISLTDRCNYRCTYCMPEEGVQLSPRADILTFEEIVRLVEVFRGLGVRRVRLTGGEPTIRQRVVDLVAMLAATGVELVMTSNGHRFPELAEPLAAAGLAGVNISIDTLDPERFRALTRRGDLERVLRGIDAAIDAGIAVKLNAVALAGVSEDDLGALCELAWSRKTVVRFIEHMPMSSGMVYLESSHLAAAEIRARLAARYGEPVEPDGPAASATGPARYFRLARSGRRFGIISAMSEHFCASCNRVRLTACGDLHACLGYDDATALRPMLRDGSPDAAIEAAIRAAVSGKREGHVFEISGLGGPRKHMVSMGG